MRDALKHIQAYPFQRLQQRLSGIILPELPRINFSLGEPAHPVPDIINDAIRHNMAKLASYPATKGSVELRETIAHWLQKRYQLPAIDPETEVLPVNGSREALFAFAQALIEHNSGAQVLCPNPCYQIYPAAAALAGAQVIYLNRLANQSLDFSAVARQARNIKLCYLCSPDNPSGQVIDLETWKIIFALSDRYGFMIAADECYSEIYFDRPPLGALAAAQQLGRGFERLVVFSSLSKRSSVPGMRSGFVAGDALILKSFLRYREYQGSAMNPMIQAASIAAWQDEVHVEQNRKRYVEKFTAVVPILRAAGLQFSEPQAGFYLWLNISHTGFDDEQFAENLCQAQNILVLPGSYLADAKHAPNPGRNYIRLALVADTKTCVDGAQRIAHFMTSR